MFDLTYSRILWPYAGMGVYRELTIQDIKANLRQGLRDFEPYLTGNTKTFYDFKHERARPWHAYANDILSEICFSNFLLFIQNACIQASSWDNR